MFVAMAWQNNRGMSQYWLILAGQQPPTAVARPKDRKCLEAGQKVRVASDKPLSKRLGNNRKSVGHDGLLHGGGQCRGDVEALSTVCSSVVGLMAA